jgi:hypothetical protein
MTMTLIETKTLGTAAASIEFTSIPQNGTDLYFLISARTNDPGLEDLYISLNGSTSGFTSRALEGQGAAASSSTVARYLGTINGAAQTANTFGNVSLYIPNYSGATNKSFSVDAVTENNATTAIQTIAAGLWSNTAAITSVAFTPTGGSLLADTIISLYKITKGSDGIVTTS